MNINGLAAFIGKSFQGSKKTIFLGATVGWIAVGLNTASAQGVLTIDESNPANVIFSATGFNSLANYSTSAGNGVDILNFFTQGITLPISPFSSNLIGGSSGVAYDSIAGDNQSGTYVDLSLYVSSSESLQTFSTSQSAFTGSGAFDLSGYASWLPALGASGNIIAGFSEAPGAIIGTWSVVAPVPEPGTTGLAVFGSLISAVAFLRHRRSLKQS